MTGGSGANAIDLSGVTTAAFTGLTGSFPVTIDGAGGGDTITGSPFNDSITGGAGNDTYVFGNNWGADKFTE